MALPLTLMVVDGTLVIVFVASAVVLWYRLSAKIPELIAIPDEVITARLQEESAKLRLFLLHIKSYYREEKYKDTFWRVLGKTLYKVHIGLLRLDNGTVSFLKKVKENSGTAVFSNGNGNGNEDYGKQLKNEPSPIAKEASRIQEIKVKK